MKSEALCAQKIRTTNHLINDNYYFSSGIIIVAVQLINDWPRHILIAKITEARFLKNLASVISRQELTHLSLSF